MQLLKKLSIYGFITFTVACNKQPNSLFTLVETTKTNINFANTIVENENLNMINYQYLYNGGGVGIGDFNNDNKPDIYFTSSLGANKLYLNKGNFQFQDITTIAGVDGGNKWCKGVSVVDINNDGKEDIYVAAAVWNSAQQRKNLLYINQGLNNNGIPVFKDMAEEYGLADTSNTHMAAFFDYDKDGDLDVYLLVNDLNEESPNTFKPINNKGTAKTTDKLLRNDWNEALKHPQFTNVSQQAGITWEGYGLGVNITDINNDTWPDILVSNDYLSGNILYINNQNGSFTNQVNQYFQHTSLNAMGNDVADINNDGLPDIIETDMAPEDNYRSKMMMNPLDYNWYLYTKMYQFPYQVVRNTLQINRGFYQKNAQTAPQPIFSEVAFAANVAYTDWSWAPLLVDVDNDGFKDLMVTNGLPKDITDLDFIAYRDQTQSPNLTALLLKLPEVKINNYLFKNNGNGEFTDKTIEWGWQNPGFSAGIATADFDNDGDMDVVINNTNSVASVYENKANTINNNRFLNITLSSPLNSKIVVNGAKIYLYYGDEKQVAEYNPYRGYMSSQQKMVHFGVGNRLTVDSVKVIWPNATETVLKNVASNQLLTIHYNTQNTQPHKPQFIYNSLFEDISAQANILFEHQQADVVDFNFQRNLPHKLSEYGPAVAVGDVNADGLHDMVIGGNSVQPAFIYFQQPDGHFEAKFLNSNPIAQTTTDAGLCLFDADNDNDLDLYIATSGFEQKDNPQLLNDRFYENNGKGFFTLVNNALPPTLTNKSCVKAADFDNDGKIDLLIGSRVTPLNYPIPQQSYILKNTSVAGKIAFVDVTLKVAPQLQTIGMVTDAVWTDFDNDEDWDLLVTGEWMGLHLFENKKGVFHAVENEIKNMKGWWNSLAAADLDNDGDIDYIAGNYGTNGFYKASNQQPVTIYAGDFTKTNKTNILIGHYRPQEPHGIKKPFSALYRDQIAEALPLIKKKYNNYSGFAQATMTDIKSIWKNDIQYSLEATQLKSVWIENVGKGRFAIHELPQEAQWAPIYGITTADYNADGLPDILLNGNDYSQSPFMGRSDALHGLLLLQTPNKQFKTANIGHSGICIQGNGKALAQLLVKNIPSIVATTNKAAMYVYKNKAIQGQVITPNLTDKYAIINLQNGKKRKVEFSYGHSFYSQSANFIWKDETIKDVKIISSKN